MIKHHPSESLLAQYCSAQLPASLSVAVSIHVDMCPVCQAKVAKLEAANAKDVFSEPPHAPAPPGVAGPPAPPRAGARRLD